MKKRSYLFLFICPLLFLHCGGNDDCPSLGIERVFPNNSGPGEPVLIKGEGFSSSTTVSFADQRAVIEEFNGEYISTKVPVGLLGVVELSVSNGDKCLDIDDFEVTGISSSLLPPSPPVYIIPPAGFSFPPQIDIESSMYFRNLYDEEHWIFLTSIMEDATGTVLTPRNGSETFGNSIWNTVTSSKIDLAKNQITISIDRTESGLPQEDLEGGLYTLTLRVDGTLVRDNFLIVFSKNTGRQYVFQRSF